MIEKNIRSISLKLNILQKNLQKFCQAVFEFIIIFKNMASYVHNIRYFSGFSKMLGISSKTSKIKESVPQIFRNHDQT